MACDLNRDIIARIYFANSVKGICWINMSFDFVQILRGSYLFFLFFFLLPFPFFQLIHRVHTWKPNEINHKVEACNLFRGFATIRMAFKYRAKFASHFAIHEITNEAPCGVKCGIARQTSGALSNRVGLPIATRGTYIYSHFICKQISRQYVIFGMREWILDLYVCVCAYVSRIYFLPIDETREIKLKYARFVSRIFKLWACKDFQTDISVQ